MELLNRQKDIDKNKLLAILERSIDAIIYVNAYNKIIFFNNAAEVLLGYDRDEVIGNNLSVIFPIEFREKHQGYIDSNRKMGMANKVAGMNRDLVVEHKNGEKRWVNISLNKLGDNEETEYVAIFRDIDGQRKKNLLLKTSEKRLKEISNIASLGSWQYEFKSKTLTLSDETYHLLGLSTNDSINSLEEFYKYIHPVDLQSIYKCFKNPKSVEPCIDLELQYKQPDNSYKYMQLRILPVYEDNELTMLFGINQDINERKQLELELLENKKRYEGLFNSVFEAIVVHNNERIIEVNEAFRKLFLFDKKEVVDKRILDLVPDYEHNKLRALHISGSNKPYETIGVKKNGVEFPIELHTKSKTYKGNDFIIVGIRDLSEIKASQFEFRKNGQILNLASRIANMGGWEYGIKSGLLVLTGNLFKVFGVKEGETFTFSEAMKYYTKESRKIVKKAFNDALKSGKEFNLELLINTPNGDLKYIQQIGVIEKIGDKVDRIYGMIRDISARKMLEHEQNQLLEKDTKLADLEKLISNSDNASQLAKAVLKKLNEYIPQCSYLSFFSKSFDVNDAFFSLCSIIDTEYFEDSNKVFFKDEIVGIEKLINGENVNFYNLNKVDDKDNFTNCLLNYQVASCHIIPLIHNKQELLGFIALGIKKNHDILSMELDYVYSIRNRISRSFNRHLLARQVQKKNELLSVVNRELKQSINDLKIFSHAMSHDLKAPLSGMMNLLDWIKDDHKDELSIEAKTKIELLTNSAFKMNNSIQGVLSYVSVNNKNNDKTEIDLNKIIQEVLKALILPKHVVVSVPEQSIIVKAETMLLNKLLQNLISNAVNYNDKKECRITFNFIEDSKYCHFSITDNGVGIASSQFDEIFELYQKAGKSMADSSGIGLAIVKKIVNIHQGEIWVESELGIGTTFHVKIPK